MKNPAPQGEALLGALRDLRTRTAPGFALGYSVDWNATEALIAGGDAWFSVAGGAFPEPCLKIVAAVQRGDAAEARRLDAGLQPLWDLFTEFSSLRVIYAAVNRLGICRAIPPRPLLPLPEAAQLRIGHVLAELGLA